MNYWDGSKLVCLFPNYTFKNLLIRNKFKVDRAPNSQNTQLAIEKYISRGYSPVSIPGFVAGPSDPHFNPESYSGLNWSLLSEDFAEIIYTKLYEGKLCIQDLPRLTSTGITYKRNQIIRRLDSTVLQSWAVKISDLVIEEEIKDRWCLGGMELKSATKKKNSKR